jgi:hypothetical protein
MKLTESPLVWGCVLLTAVLFFGGCMMSACAKDNEDSVVWYWSKAYTKRVESLKIKPDEAFKIAWKEWEKTKHPISKEPAFIIGRWYRFGMEAKTDTLLAGYYVNGDTGKVEYRESKKLLKPGSKKLPKEAWSKITPLPETSSKP